MSQLVLASGNIGKLRELSQIISPLGLKLIAQADLKVPEAEETGLSFVENAIIKARNAALFSDLPAIADDSGIEVDALRGAPGIYPSRYAGTDASDTNNIRALLSAMKDVPKSERTARFQCVVVFMRHAEDPTPLICQGSWQGQILQSPTGDEGFGYDPIFWVSETDCTAAELSPEQKHAISHRGKAMRQFMEEFKYTRHQP